MCGVIWRYQLAWSTKRVPVLYLAELGVPWKVGVRPGEVLSNWSPETQSPGSRWETSIWLESAGIGWWCCLSWMQARPRGAMQVPKHWKDFPKEPDQARDWTLSKFKWPSFWCKWRSFFWVEDRFSNGGKTSEKDPKREVKRQVAEELKDVASVAKKIWKVVYAVVGNCLVRSWEGKDTLFAVTS